jgi:prolyl oligopeptidase
LFLEDATDSRTEAWSAEQDAVFAAALADWPSLRPELAKRYAVGFTGAPYWRGDRSFAVSRDPDQDHPVLAVTEPDGARRVLVDPSALDPDGTTTLDVWSPSREGGLLAYATSTGGTEWAEIRVLDVTTGATVDGPIDRTRHPSIAWLPGGAEFFYVRFLPGEELRQRVYRHRVGTDPSDDVEVFGAGLPRATYLGVRTSEDGHWLTVTAERGTDARNDLWVADLTAAEIAFTPVVVGEDALSYPLFDAAGTLYVLTTLDAPRRRLCRVDPWTVVLPEDPEAILDDVAVLAGPGLVVAVRTRHAVSEVSVHDLATGLPLRDVALPGVGSVGELTDRSSGTDVWLGYTDYTTPYTVLKADAVTGAVGVHARPSGFQPEPLRTRQVTYRSYDGTPVRMFLIEPAGPPGPKPTILYGYGGFNIAMTPGYSALIHTWVSQGGVYAVANLRGGSEEGEAWHRAGMREHKTNVFDDFAAASDHLVDTGLTTRAQLGISGRSNGGLLVGAALTRHPEKYAAVVCAAPLLDMLRYEKFGLGELWNGEYGRAADPVERSWLESYSPYHHVTAGVAYPATLFVVFDGDTRVDPLHARKMCALLQSATGGRAPILIRRETGVGHSSRAVSRDVDLSADELGFLLCHLT